ncbi:uncharacterized protein IAS62_003114 [Cryptococcus decagattii]|uniref:Uncharacterized protein n=1 Tax=Cryptococcus decagattii TaxID=1859122 RepID=A0ABZ2AWR2_9TREE
MKNSNDSGLVTREDFADEAALDLLLSSSTALPSSQSSTSILYIHSRYGRDTNKVERSMTTTTTPTATISK